MNITFNTDGVAMPDIEPQRIRDWVQRVAQAHGRRVGEVNYIFVSDERILDINRQFLGHDYYTDIITFDYSNSRRISGDMVISLDTVASNAQMLEVDYHQELLRVIVHGVLHLCGINDKGPGEREIMEQHENEALAILPENSIEQ